MSLAGGKAARHQLDRECPRIGVAVAAITHTGGIAQRVVSND